MTSQQTLQAQLCANHSDRPAKWVCNRCGKAFCDECVKTRDFTTFQAHFCRDCGGQCNAIEPLAQTTAKSFADGLARAWSYPVKGKGLYVLIGGTIFYTLMDWLLGTSIIILHPGTSMIFGLLQLILALIFLGYLFAYAFRVVSETAGGDDEPPDWPDFGDPAEFLRPLGLVLAVLVLCLSPVIAYGIAVGAGAAESSPVLSWLLLGIGLAFMPMSLLSAALYDSLAGLNPVHLFRSIVRVGPAYLAAVGMLAAVVLLGFLLLVVQPIRIPILSSFFGVAVELYCIMAAMRIIGLLYANYEQRLRWFSAD
ncbi:MAG: B-box zinc finger protein [Phycisphaerae bacterium]